MNEKLVSIAMATYNGEYFLKEQLESLLNQTYRNIEIIIGNCGFLNRISQRSKI